MVICIKPKGFMKNPYGIWKQQCTGSIVNENMQYLATGCFCHVWALTCWCLHFARHANLLIIFLLLQQLSQFTFCICIVNETSTI